MNASPLPPPGGKRGAASLTTLVRERTAGGLALVDFHVSMMHDQRARNGDRLAAAAWLGDRGFGKAIGMDVLIRVDAAKSSGSLPTLDTAVLEALVCGPVGLLGAGMGGPGPLSAAATPAPIDAPSLDNGTKSVVGRSAGPLLHVHDHGHGASPAASIVEAEVVHDPD